jgi:predicted RNase H-like HicB family nuclease
MKKPTLTLTLEYWRDAQRYVGQLREVPGVMSQGETLEALQEHIRDAYELVLKDSRARRAHPSRSRSKSMPICVPA